MNKKIKLSLNKTIISRLQNNEQNSVFGGAPTNTFNVECANNTYYPACGNSGCWGAASCPSFNPQDTCQTELSEGQGCNITQD